MFGPKRPTFHGYAAATRMRPEWRVAFLVFKGGVNEVRNGSLTGGGQIYGHEFQAFTGNLMYPNAPGVFSVTGGGQIPAFPAELIALYGGQVGQGS